VSETVEHIDEESLAEAQRLLGTATSQDTVNQALREVIRRRLVREYLEFMRSVEPDELHSVRERAWQ
jgi:Arc/MetJ family transcription regulator